MRRSSRRSSTHPSSRSTSSSTSMASDLLRPARTGRGRRRRIDRRTDRPRPGARRRHLRLCSAIGLVGHLTVQAFRTPDGDRLHRDQPALWRGGKPGLRGRRLRPPSTPSARRAASDSSRDSTTMRRAWSCSATAPTCSSASIDLLGPGRSDDARAPPARGASCSTSTTRSTRSAVRRWRVRTRSRASRRAVRPVRGDARDAPSELARSRRPRSAVRHSRRRSGPRWRSATWCRPASIAYRTHPVGLEPFPGVIAAARRPAWQRHRDRPRLRWLRRGPGAQARRPRPLSPTARRRGPDRRPRTRPRQAVADPVPRRLPAPRRRTVGYHLRRQRPAQGLRGARAAGLRTIRIGHLPDEGGGATIDGRGRRTMPTSPSIRSVPRPAMLSGTTT